MKLEPTEVQRKAMAVELKAFGGWTLETCHKAIDALIAAANSIPEGMPVGTIARRPDGAWKAERKAGGAGPYWHYSTSAFWQADSPDWNSEDDADSWPVIYDPTKPEQKTYPYAEGDTIVIGPECFQVPSKGAIAWKGVWYFDPDYQLNWFPPGEEPLVPRPDPTAQQEPDRFPGIENPTTADHVGADNADEQLKLIFALQCIRVERGLSVAHVGEALGLEDSEVERFESGSTNPTMSMIRRYARAVEAVFTVDVRKWEDSSAQQEPGESLARGLDDIAAGRVSRRDDYLEPQQEPADRLDLIDPIQRHRGDKPSRTPRVVYRLGVNEQGSRWQDRQLGEWKFDGQAWRYLELTWTSVPGGEWVEAEPSKRYGPYVEVLS